MTLRLAPPGLSRASAGALLALTLGLLAAPTRAHDRSVSQSSVEVQGHEVRARVRLRSVDVSALSSELAVWAHELARGGGPSGGAALPRELVDALAQRFRVHDDAGDPCRLRAPVRVPSDPAELRLRLVFECAGTPTRLVITPWPVPGHHHLVHVSGGPPGGTLIVGEPREVSLAHHAAEPGATPADVHDERADVAQAMGAYLLYGAEHAALGWDHVLFVLLLLAFATRARDAAVLVTGFTLGHALTLALAALSVLSSRARAVEALIAASVVLVAAENVARTEPSRAGRVAAPLLVALGGLALGLASGERALVFFGLFAACAVGLRATRGTAEAPDTRARLTLALAFGLVHGLGFASGFDAAGPLRVPRLVAFNLGVELAQLGWLALAWPLLSRLGGPEAERRVAAVRALSLVACAMATYACVGRALANP